MSLVMCLHFIEVHQVICVKRLGLGIWVDFFPFQLLHFAITVCVYVYNPIVSYKHLFDIMMIFIQYFISLLHFITSLLQHSSKIPCLSISLDLYLRHMSLSYVFFSFILPISFFFYFTLVAVCCYLSISFAFVTMLQTYFLISSASVSFALTLYWIFFLSFLCLSQRLPRIVSSVFYVLAVCFMRRWNLFVNPIL